MARKGIFRAQKTKPVPNQWLVATGAKEPTKKKKKTTDRPYEPLDPELWPTLCAGGTTADPDRVVPPWSGTNDVGFEAWAKKADELGIDRIKYSWSGGNSWQPQPSQYLSSPEPDDQEQDG